MRAWFAGGIALWLCAASAATQAQLLIGQTAGFSGAVATGVKEATEGAQLYFDNINARGGIAGQKIELLSLDDKFDPKLAAENARVLVEDKNVLALFLTRGTPHTEAIIPVLDKYGVALVGPSTGAMVLHKPVQKHVFNVRATYQREAEKAIAHLATIGSHKIAVVYADDSFGADGLAGAQKGLAAAQLKAVAVQKFDRAKPDFSAIAPAVVQAGAQAVLLVASGTAAVDGIKALKAAGSNAQMLTLSNNANTGFIASLGAAGPGLIVTQVFPNSLNYAFVKEFADLARAKGQDDASSARLEGFVAAKVLVAALGRAGAKPSRASLQAALDNLGKLDIGGLEVAFSPSDHSGLDFADLSIISRDGKFRR